MVKQHTYVEGYAQEDVPSYNLAGMADAVVGAGKRMSDGASDLEVGYTLGKMADALMLGESVTLAAQADYHNDRSKLAEGLRSWVIECARDLKTAEADAGYLCYAISYFYGFYMYDISVSEVWTIPRGSEEQNVMAKCTVQGRAYLVGLAGFDITRCPSDDTWPIPEGCCMDAHYDIFDFVGELDSDDGGSHD